MVTPAAAQDVDGRFSTGPIAWTPTIALRDVGFDTNVFDEAVDPKRDRMATLTPQVNAVIDSPHAKVQASGVVDLVYFERYDSERAVNRRIALRTDLPFSRFVPFVAGGYERVRERQGYEIDLRAEREGFSGSVGLALTVTPRGALHLAVSQGELTYDAGQTFRGLDLAQELNRTTQTATVGFRYNVTPFTTLLIDAIGVRERHDKSIRDTEDVRAQIGVAFAPDAVISGRAVFGYHQLDTQFPQIPFRGFHAGVNLSYTLLDMTRFDVRYGRDTAVSIDAPYFLLTDYGLEITQDVIGPFGLIARAAQQRLDYPGIESVLVEERLDRIDVYGGGVALRMSDRARATVTYEVARRQSTIPLGNFDRRRLLSGVTFAF